ncbi:MAG: nucleotide exchange factor GrpE [Burkholderiales bacterium]|jgi:molecular chaperone GrpE|nr:nucleotide exchange factor GrpE [Burkholderiales bacterium]MCE1177098.1 nucleotide exchange factor GrpE [Burkholderiales bacterium]
MNEQVKNTQEIKDEVVQETQENTIEHEETVLTEDLVEGSSIADDDATENQLSALEQENARLKDQLLRTVAEMDNVRRRAAEDVSKAHKFSIEKFAESLVPVQDSLEKALQDDSGDMATLREGVELTFKQLVAALEKNGVVELNPKGEKFDPHFHQAISMVPSDLESGLVVDVLQKGFKIADRVLRPALVIVAQ